MMTESCKACIYQFHRYFFLEKLKRFEFVPMVTFTMTFLSSFEIILFPLLVIYFLPTAKVLLMKVAQKFRCNQAWISDIFHCYCFVFVYNALWCINTP